MRPRRGRPPKHSIEPSQYDGELPFLYDIWNKALASPHGYAVPTTKPHLLAGLLYRARRECGHQAYAALRVVEREEEVWICPR